MRDLQDAARVIGVAREGGAEETKTPEEHVFMTVSVCYIGTVCLSMVQLIVCMMALFRGATNAIDLSGRICVAPLENVCIPLPLAPPLAVWSMTDMIVAVVFLVRARAGPDVECLATKTADRFAFVARLLFTLALMANVAIEAVLFLVIWVEVLRAIAADIRAPPIVLLTAVTCHVLIGFFALRATISRNNDACVLLATYIMWCGALVLVFTWTATTERARASWRLLLVCMHAAFSAVSFVCISTRSV